MNCYKKGMRGVSGTLKQRRRPFRPNGALQIWRTSILWWGTGRPSRSVITSHLFPTEGGVLRSRYNTPLTTTASEDNFNVIAIELHIRTHRFHNGSDALTVSNGNQGWKNSASGSYQGQHELFPMHRQGAGRAGRTGSVERTTLLHWIGDSSNIITGHHNLCIYSIFL
jgi:hypothetical protein